MNRTSTLARLERILVMVPWLLEHPGVEVDEVTERFGVGRAELARDLDLLGYCGLPGYGGGDLIETSVVGDRVTVRLAEFFRRPLTLTVSEGLTLLLAASALAAVPGLPESAALRRALEKVEHALGAQPHLAIELAGPGDELLPLLRDAIEQRRVVHLRYLAASTRQTTERDVEPEAIVGARGAWYLQAWCRLARGPRDFRLDRIAAAHTLDETVDAPAGRRRDQAARYEPASDDVEVVLDLDPAAWWLPEEVVVDRLEEHGDVRRLVLRTRTLEWVARLVLSAAPAVRVVAPPALGARVAALADEALAHYS